PGRPHHLLDVRLPAQRGRLAELASHDLRTAPGRNTRRTGAHRRGQPQAPVRHHHMTGNAGTFEFGSQEWLAAVEELLKKAVDGPGDGRRRTAAGRGPPDGRAHRRRDRLAGSAHGAPRVAAQRACPAHTMTDAELRPEPSFLDLTLWALRRFPDRIAIVEDDR